MNRRRSLSPDSSNRQSICDSGCYAYLTQFSFIMKGKGRLISSVTQDYETSCTCLLAKLTIEQPGSSQRAYCGNCSDAARQAGIAS